MSEPIVSSLVLDRASGQPLYRQLADALAARIAGGELATGARLPSEREMADQLAISRTTAVNAYRELEARGLVRGHVGRGTFVCAAPDGDGAPFAWRGKVARGAQRTSDPGLRDLARLAADPRVISFAAASSAIELFPVDAFQAATERVLRAGAGQSLGLRPTEGHARLRRAIAARERARPEEVLVVSGAQQGLDLVARCLLDPGDAVVMDRPGYLGAIQLFRSVGAHVVGWDVARYDLEELEDLLLRYRPKLLYLNPTFQNPTGRIMDIGTRRELLELAARYHLPIVEDEPTRDLWFRQAPPATLRELDRHRSVIHIGTFSKTLAIGLRLGWVTADEAIIDQLTLVKQRSDVATATLHQLVVTELLTTGAFDRHLTVLRREHARRHDAMLAALAGLLPDALSTTPVAGGLVVWCRLSQSIDARDLLRAAVGAGVAFVAGSAFYPEESGPTGRHELRLSFASQPAEHIAEGLRRLAGAIASAEHGRVRVAGSRVIA